MIPRQDWSVLSRPTRLNVGFLSLGIMPPLRLADASPQIRRLSTKASGHGRLTLQLRTSSVYSHELLHDTEKANMVPELILHPGQRRLACEGCRQQKMKCVRPGDNAAACVRCTRLSLPCRSGAQGRIGRPSRPRPPVVAGSTSGSPLDIGDSLDIESPVATGSPLPSESISGDGERIGTLAKDPLPATALALGRSGSQSPGPFLALDNSVQLDLSLDTTWDPFAVFAQSPSASVDALLPRSSPIQSAPPPLPRPSAGPCTNSCHDLLAALSEINLALHAERAKIRHDQLDNTSIFCLDPLGSACEPADAIMACGVGIVERALVAAQHFLQTLGRLHRRVMPRPGVIAWTVEPRALTLGPSRDDSIEMLGAHDYFPPRGAGSTIPNSNQPSKLDAPTALLIISCYVQIINLFEITIRWIELKLQHAINGEPLDAIEGITFGALKLSDGYLQAIIFVDIVWHLLVKTERLLGVVTTDDEQSFYSTQLGLLSGSRHIEMLYCQLESPHRDWAPRPAQLRERLLAAKDILTAASIASQA